MLLVCDIGNSNTVCGLYDGERLVEHWRLGTNRKRTADEWALLLYDLMQLAHLHISAIKAAVVASVVPPLTSVFTHAVYRMAGITPMVVGPGIKTGMPILTESPKEVGADRIVNAVAAYAHWPQALIIVDMGTATTFDCVSAKGEYLGGAIAPGVAISIDALFHAAAKLPRVDVSRPAQVIGRNTVESMQSGIYFGYLGLVDGLVQRMKKQMDTPVKVVATGGIAELLARDSGCIEAVDHNLTLQGLRLLYERNRES